MPAMKELEFFDSRYGQGLGWYKSLFREAGNRVCGEISPQYVHDPLVLERMRFLAGHVRLVVSFRNPADRAFSHYLMDARERSGMSESDKIREFGELVTEAGSKYVEFGFYARQLKPYIEVFGRENIHCVLFDDIAKDPAQVVRSAFEFLGVNSAFVPTALRTPVNVAKRYRSASAFRFLRGTVRIAEKMGMARLILDLKRTAVRERVLRLLEIEEEYAPLRSSIRARLVAVYRSSNFELAHLIGRDLDAWNHV